ncbi:hypothetical protein [Streptomyces sp. NPDC059651]|uniref:hypothetical protein n=1 Tax=Streptomyces sp. NPDC059651 TaxID=3346897 RepID=UPI003687086A
MLDDGAISVGDILGVSRYIQTIGAPGAHHIRVTVDDPGIASRIDVVIDSGRDGRALTSVNGYPLPRFVVADNSSLGRSDELGLILSTHDLPLNRLAASLKVIKLASESDESDRVEILREFRMKMVREWLRWISADASADTLPAIDSHISEHLNKVSLENLDRASVELAADTLARLGVHHP